VAGAGRRISTLGDGITGFLGRIGEAVGKELTYEGIAPEVVRRILISHGFPEPIADSYLGYQTASVEQPGPLTETVKRTLGRPALSFAEWASEYAAFRG
jgi:hypothetical protein